MIHTMIDTFRWAPNGNEVFQGNLEHIPNVLVHLTTADRVESILKNGLILGSKRNSESGEIKGIYFAVDMDVLAMDAMESFDNMVVLKVDVSEIKHLLLPDPEWRSSDHDNPMHCEDDIAWYIDKSVDAKYIKVLK